MFLCIWKEFRCACERTPRCLAGTDGNHVVAALDAKGHGFDAEVAGDRDACPSGTVLARSCPESTDVHVFTTFLFHKTRIPPSPACCAEFLSPHILTVTVCTFFAAPIRHLGTPSRRECHRLDSKFLLPFLRLGAADLCCRFQLAERKNRTHKNLSTWRSCNNHTQVDERPASSGHFSCESVPSNVPSNLKHTCNAILTHRVSRHAQTHRSRATPLIRDELSLRVEKAFTIQKAHATTSGWRLHSSRGRGEGRGHSTSQDVQRVMLHAGASGLLVSGKLFFMSWRGSRDHQTFFSTLPVTVSDQLQACSK